MKFPPTNWVFLTLLVPVLVYSHCAHGEPDCATNVPPLRQLTYGDASKAVDDEEHAILGTERVKKRICAEYFTNLVNEIAAPELGNDNRVLGIWLLGELRPTDTNSIELLIRYIDLEATKFDIKSKFARWGQYPAEEALEFIGAPAVVEPLLRHLAIEEKPLRRALICKALADAQDDKSLATRQVAEKMAAESDPVKRARLEASLAALRNR